MQQNVLKYRVLLGVALIFIENLIESKLPILEESHILSLKDWQALLQSEQSLFS